MKKSILPTIVETQIGVRRTGDYKTDKIPQINDEWFLCSTCHQRKNPCSLLNHKQYHKASILLGYKPEDTPSHLHDLNYKKKQLISQIDRSCDYKQREYQKIQRSYEILKAKFISVTPYTSRMSILCDGSCHVHNMDINNKLIKAIGVCSDQNSSWQSDMEDAFTVLNNYGQRKNTCFAGIFDGYHGKEAACNTAQELPILFLDQISHLDPSYQLTEEEKHFISSFHTVFLEHYKESENKFSLEKKNVNGANTEDIHLAYAKAFWRMDRMLKLGRKESSKSRWSGCSAVTCLIDGHAITDTCHKTENMHPPMDMEKKRLGMLHLANIGNIKVVLCRNGKSYCLTKDHSPASYQERTRVRESGGTVSVNADSGLIEGFCRVTRGLGFHGDPKLKTSVIPAPYTISISIYHTCQFLILASGLWDVLSESDVVTMAQELLQAFLTGTYNVKREDVNPQEDIHANSMSDNPKAPAYVYEDSTRTETMENLSDCDVKAKISCNTHNTKDIYKAAAAFVCQTIVMTAKRAGSQQNITICLILLPGCHEI